METTITISNRYQIIDKLGQGGMGVVYKAYDRLEKTEVALKQVLLPPSQLDFASKAGTDDTDKLRLSLAQEFSILATLRHPHILSVLDFGFDGDGHPFYTMTLLEGGQDVKAYAADIAIGRRINLLGQMLQALHYLHRRGVLHCDLKPDNVFVMPDERVKLMDFGLAKLEKAQSSQSDTIEGTINYMAPEQFQGETASVASDLHAVGVIAYEIMAGQYPFEAEIIGERIMKVMTHTPDMSAIPADFAPWLGKILEKDPAKRFATAYDAMIAFYEAVGVERPAEDQTIRESFLQASTFVGRDAELKQLTDALDTLQTENAFFLIGGESGVGKSRLLDEFRIRALVKGATVLRGQAVSSGGQPFHLWFEPLHQVALQLSPSELQMGVLKTLLPDLEQLLERPIPLLPPITDAQANQERTLQELILILSSLAGSSVLFLEDLHWADNASLLLLERVSNVAGLVIATYRHDQAPHLSARFPQAQQIRLERLTRDQCQALSVAMLGEIGQQPRIGDFIHKETEGNVFFIVEVVRALAEQVGRLEAIDEANLPEVVLTDGIRQTVERRLAALPDNLHALVNSAAVMGRQLDTAVLGHLHAGPLETWLSKGAELLIVEPFEDGWRFTHDKLRDYLLGALAEEHKALLHRQVALGIEHVYGDHVRMVSSLAYHWQAGGDYGKAQRYGFVAGRMAFEQGAIRDATGYLQHIEPHSLNKAEQIELHRMLAEAYYGLGDFTASYQHAIEGLQGFKPAFPVGSRGFLLGTLRQGAQHLWHQFAQAKLMPFQPFHKDIARLSTTLGAIAVHEDNLLLFFYITLWSLNFSEKAQMRGGSLLGYAGLTLIFARLTVLRRYYSRKIERSLPALTDEAAKADALLVYATTHIQIGDWHNANEFLREGQAAAEGIGNKRRLDEYQTLMSYRCIMIGDYEEGWALALHAAHAAQQRHDLQIYLDSLTLQLSTLLRQDEAKRAEKLVDEIQTLLDNDLGGYSFTWTPGLVALQLFQSGETGLALKWVETSIEAMAGKSANTIWTIEGAVGNAEVLLGLLEAKTETAAVRREQLLTLWQENFRFMASYALISPVTGVYTQLFRGRMSAFEGKTAQAMRAWRKAHALATRFHLPYEQGVLADLLRKSTY